MVLATFWTRQGSRGCCPISGAASEFCSESRSCETPHRNGSAKALAAKAETRAPMSDLRLRDTCLRNFKAKEALPGAVVHAVWNGARGPKVWGSVWKMLIAQLETLAEQLPNAFIHSKYCEETPFNPVANETCHTLLQMRSKHSKRCSKHVFHNHAPVNNSELFTSMNSM